VGVRTINTGPKKYTRKKRETNLGLRNSSCSFLKWKKFPVQGGDVLGSGSVN